MKTVIEMAQEARLGAFHLDDDSTLEALERFATLVREDERDACVAECMEQHRASIEAAVLAEREACAKVCEAEAVNVKWNDYIEGCEDCAAAIRARGEK